MNRKGQIKDVIQEFSLCLVLSEHGFLCMPSVLRAPSLGGSVSIRVARMISSADEAAGLRKAKSRVQSPREPMNSAHQETRPSP